MYSARNLNDSIGLKTLVYGAFLVETIQTILATYDCWNQLNLKSLIVTTILDVGFMWVTVPIITGISELHLSSWISEVMKLSFM